VAKETRCLCHPFQRFDQISLSTEAIIDGPDRPVSAVREKKRYLVLRSGTCFGYSGFVETKPIIIDE
jgi:hypothetical protein